MNYQTLENEVKVLYEKLLQRNKSAIYLKVDIHVHSPASRDYKRVRKGNSDEEEYELFLNNFIESDLEIIAITDHNTATGFFDIKGLLERKSTLKERIGKKLILPGVEITCFGKHFLAIFSEETTKDKFDAFLLECGIGIEEQGLAQSSADRVTPVTLCEVVQKYNGVVVIAHCDAEHGLLETYFGNNHNSSDDGLRGSSITKVLQSKAVYGICFNSDSNLERLKEIRANFKVQHLALVQASDSHSSELTYKGSGLPLGSRCFWAKLGERSFKALLIALRNEESRIIINEPTQKENPIILGICVKGGFLKDKNDSEWAIFPFSEGLNCIIGARGTGKSTLLDILKIMLISKSELQNEDSNSLWELIKRFDVGVVYIKSNRKIFAIRMEPYSVKQLGISYYQLTDEKFKRVRDNRGLKNNLNKITNNLPVSQYLTMTNIQSYRQKELFTLAVSPLGPTLVIDSLCALLYQKDFLQASKDLNKYRENIIEHSRELLLDRRKDKNADVTSDYLESEYKLFVEAHSQITIYRQETVNTLNKILKEKLNLTSSFKIPNKIAEEVYNRWIRREREKNNIKYEFQIDYRVFLSNQFKNTTENWQLPFWIFTKNSTRLADALGIGIELAKSLCDTFYDKMDAEDVVILPSSVTEFELNVNHGISSKTVFRRRDKLSYGQRAVGMLLLILHGATELGENRPLLIDQPEDDLDNSYIYHTLVKEFLSIKHVRQLIIATHNPNIPIAGDAENILILESNGEKGWLETSGSIERATIANKVLQILEGDKEAFIKRAEKYGFTF